MSRSAFAPYGHLSAPGTSGVRVDEGNAIRHDVHYFEAAEADPSLSLVTSVFEVVARPQPGVIASLERHPRSAQLIMPVSVDDHIVVVCSSQADGRPDPAGFAAFRLNGRQGVIFKPGLWHHPIIALGRNGLFLVQSWQDGTRRDREVTHFAPLAIGA